MDGQVLVSPPGWRKGVNSYVVSFDRTGGPKDEKGRTKFYPTGDIGKYRTEDAARRAAEKVVLDNIKRPVPADQNAQPAEADQYAKYAGKMVEQQVQVGDTGKTATLRMDAGKAMRQLDERETALKKLLDCLGSKS